VDADAGEFDAPGEPGGRDQFACRLRNAGISSWSSSRLRAAGLVRDAGS
jgi:hypothetical protein